MQFLMNIETCIPTDLKHVVQDLAAYVSQLFGQFAFRHKSTTNLVW